MLIAGAEHLLLTEPHMDGSGQLWRDERRGSGGRERDLLLRRPAHLATLVLVLVAHRLGGLLTLPAEGRRLAPIGRMPQDPAHRVGVPHDVARGGRNAVGSEAGGDAAQAYAGVSLVIDAPHNRRRRLVGDQAHLAELARARTVGVPLW